MKRITLWIAAAVILIALPAIAGLVLLGGDGNDRRAGSLVAATAGDDTLVVNGITPPNKAIDVLSFSWGVVQVGSATSTGGAIAGKANFQDFQIMKTVDETSHKLALSVANGKHIPDMTLTVTKAGTVPAVIMTYKFTDVIVTSVAQSHSQGSGLPTESVSFNYSKMELAMNALDAKGGVAPAGKMTWDLKANIGA